MRAALALAACGSSEAASPNVASTVGDVGALPADLPVASLGPHDRGAGVDRTEHDRGTFDHRRPRPRPPRAERGTTVGQQAEGNRVIVIGDSIMASISNRYGNQLCEQLVPKGWAVEVDAEVGRFVEFGRQVLDERPPRLWDAAVVMLGNNYAGDPDAFRDELRRLLDELDPLPIVLLTVTPFEPEQDEVNYVAAVEADRRDDVQLVDWAGRTTADVPDVDELLTGDGLHLATAGQEALAAMIGRAMGRAPAGSRGECLRSSFRDDSAGSLPEGSGGRSEGSGSGGAAAAAAAAAPAVPGAVAGRPRDRA